VMMQLTAKFGVKFSGVRSDCHGVPYGDSS